MTTDRAEMARASKEAKERLPGSFISLKEDKEKKSEELALYDVIEKEDGSVFVNLP
jgi:hypothetical protein